MITVEKVIETNRNADMVAWEAWEKEKWMHFMPT